MRSAAIWLSLLVMLLTAGCVAGLPSGSKAPPAMRAPAAPVKEGPVDTKRRISPGFECRLEKGKSSAGLKAFCSIDSDTVVLGQPVIFEFGLVNVGTDPAGLESGMFSLVGGNLPALFVADPAGFEYRYASYASELRSIECETAVALSPGDTLTSVFQVTYYGHHDLLFPSPGRWGLYCGYYMRGDECHRGVEVASDIAWVEVVERDSLDSLAWIVFEKTKRCLVSYDASTNDTVMAAFRAVMQGYRQSAYYPYSLYMYARSLQFSKMYDEAIEYFTRYRAEYPGTFLARESLFRIAQCLHQSGRAADAAAAFDAAHAADRWNWRGLLRYRPR